MRNDTCKQAPRRPARLSARRVLLLVSLGVLVNRAGAGNDAGDLAAEIRHQGEQALSAMQLDVVRHISDQNAWLGHLCSLMAAGTVSNDPGMPTDTAAAAPATERCLSERGNTMIAKPVRQPDIELRPTGGTKHP